ncbi:cytochrome ubiquinol oxidase subunit I [Pseudomonas sp. NFX15]
MGRQPFTVYGVLRTADSVSAVSRQQVTASAGSIPACRVPGADDGLFRGV